MLIGSVFRNLIWPAGLHRRASTPHHSAATLNNRTPRLVERPVPADFDIYGGGPVAANEFALLILGCQPEILAPIADHEELIAEINKVIDIVRIHEGTVVHARMAFDPMDYRFPPLTNKEFAAVVQEHRLENGTPGSESHPSLLKSPEDIEFRTTRLGIFSNTDLDELLTNYGITTLIIAGCHTSGAILTTIREAADRDYRIIMVEGCVADPEPELNRFLLRRIFPRQAEIWTAAQLYSSLAVSKSQQHRTATPDCHDRQYAARTKS
ncbi:cysteine hydrolase [Mycolicibacterium sp. 624]|uniref:cysteine hydrolase n=1 Tax=Mycolicibacterium sp. 624 TaxID=3156314 RepID=UPI003391C0C2